ncbi:MAG: peptidase, partial [Gemmatimonadetes bacterium]|nr:peptidase [Gemmatimonadota bacterium]
IGLWDRYGGSMPSGWTRFVFDQFEFDYEVVYPPELDAGDLNARFDVLVFPDGAIPAGEGGGGFRGGGMADAMLERLPEELRDRVGSVSLDTTVPAIIEFIENGGTVVAIGGSSRLGIHAGLPIADYMVDERGEPYSSEEYYTPGSVHDVAVQHGSPVTHGLGDRVNILHSHSPVFRVEEGAESVRVLARYDSPNPLVSGWAWGQEKLDGGASMLEADIGSGKLFLFGPKITFRGQSHGTFPLLFNGIYYGSARRDAVF